jgi:hypothetical protein
VFGFVRSRPWHTRARSSARRHGADQQTPHPDGSSPGNFTPSSLVDLIINDVNTADAAAIMQFGRTGLGEQLRRDGSDDDGTWVACTGHGRQSLLTSIELATHLAAATTGVADTT